LVNTHRLKDISGIDFKRSSNPDDESGAWIVLARFDLRDVRLAGTRGGS
jgi:hypothetical protein